jgi:hypothetical protein
MSIAGERQETTFPFTPHADRHSPTQTDHVTSRFATICRSASDQLPGTVGGAGVGRGPVTEGRAGNPLWSRLASMVCRNALNTGGRKGSVGKKASYFLRTA